MLRQLACKFVLGSAPWWLSSVAMGANYLTPTVQGRVFTSADDLGVPGVELRLYVDNGDSIFGADDSMMGTMLTGSDGHYRFDNLDPASSYFVMQPAQTAGSISLDDEVSPLRSPGAIYQLVDSFHVVQSISANPLVNSVSGSVDADPAQILGGQRDAYLEITGGVADGQLRVNPYELNSNLQVDMAAGVTGRAVLTWDGIDGAAGMAAGAGLNGIDLTHGGVTDGFLLKMAVDAAGAGQIAKLMIYSNGGLDSSVVELEMPVTSKVEPTGFAYVPFTEFKGTADPTSVDAIQLMLDTRPSLDARFSEFGILGPATADFEVSGVSVLPEPNGMFTLLIGCGMLHAVMRRRR